MNTPGKVIVFFGENPDHLHRPRTKHDTIIDDHRGAMVTWRFDYQCEPTGMQQLYSFDTAEANTAHSVAFLDHLTGFCRDRGMTLDHELALLVVSKIHDDVVRTLKEQESAQNTLVRTGELVSH